VAQNSVVLHAQRSILRAGVGKGPAAQQSRQRDQQNQCEGEPAEALDAPLLFQELQVLRNLDFADVVHRHAGRVGKKCDSRERAGEEQKPEG
jgi:hypothetical protein